MGIAPTTTEEDNKNIYYDNNDVRRSRLFERMRDKTINVNELLINVNSKIVNCLG